MTLREFLNKLYSFTNFKVLKRVYEGWCSYTKTIFKGTNIGTNEGNVPEEILNMEVLIFGIEGESLEIIVEERK